MNQEQMITLNLSKKQYNLLDEIISPNKEKISVLGSTQSGKTYCITDSLPLYAQALYEYDSTTNYNAAVVGWTTDTIKRNIVDSKLIPFLDSMNLVKKEKNNNGDYELVWNQNEKYFKIYNTTFYFFGFNTYLSFNRILGGDLIFIWVDEAARIYTQMQLQKTFDELPGRQMSFADHPFLKRIDSYNVEGSDNHPYKKKYIDHLKSEDSRHVFFPYDNPRLDTPTKIRKVKEMFPPGPLREQKVFNKWVVAEGRVFNKLNVVENLNDFKIREIGIGVDYGSVNPTTFVPIALAYHKVKKKWCLVRLQCYYHDSRELGTTPTTEFFSKQLRMFLVYLRNQYPHVPITELVVDSEATHFINRLDADNIPNTKAEKGPGSVNEGVEHLQALYEKELLYNLKYKSIKLIRDDGSVEFCGKDEALLEDESYTYDTPRSIKEGRNCYVKANDHQIDGKRYIIALFKATNRCPVV